MKVVICDATDSGVEIWLGQLKKIEKDYGVAMEISHYDTAEVMLFHMEDAVARPDLLLLDVEMPGISGMEAAKKIRAMQLHMEIIFLTSDPDHWPEAFEVSALHYLLKGEEDGAYIEKVLMRAIKRIGKQKESCFAFTCAGEKRIVPILKIRYFSVEQHITTVHYMDDDGGEMGFEFYTPIGKLENEVFNKGFARIHKSFIVGVRYMETLSLREGAVLEDGTVLPVGRAYYPMAKAAFERYLELMKPKRA